MCKNSSYKRALIILIIQMLLLWIWKKKNNKKEVGVAKRSNITDSTIAIMENN